MNIVLSAEAEKDLAALFSYIRDTLQNPIAASNTARKILGVVGKLARFPELGVKLRTVDDRFSVHRYLITAHYIVIYKITNSEVRVVRILYARSDYVNLLDK